MRHGMRGCSVGGAGGRVREGVSLKTAGGGLTDLIKESFSVVIFDTQLGGQARDGREKESKEWNGEMPCVESANKKEKADGLRTVAHSVKPLDTLSWMPSNCSSRSLDLHKHHHR